ncbi:MAG: F0F1 ATP synthase subunit B' [Alphaproteobacteria bacterium]
MPQFDPSTFPTQIFWLVLIFVVLYLVMARVALPRVAQVLDERRDRIDDDLDKAEQLKKEAEEAAQAYERTLQIARARAQLLLKALADQAASEAAAKQAKLNERMAVETKAAEERIDAARASAMGSMRVIAAEAAAAATGKLIGSKPEASQVDAAVDQALSEKR